MKIWSEYKINDLQFNGNSFSVKLDGKLYIGEINDLGFCKAVQYVRNINSTKRTTARIMSAIEMFINK